MRIAYPKFEIHTQNAKPASLLVLLAYAMSHPHSRQWVPALRRLLARVEVAHHD